VMSSRTILGVLNLPFFVLVSSSLFQQRGTECPIFLFCIRCSRFIGSRS
jgi:hypothetical protein